MADVTLRTIRYYDKQNLLKPSYVNEHGARFYTDSDFVKLQQILLFKFLGFSLSEIRDMTLNHPDRHVLLDSLDIQLKLVKDRREQLQLMEQTIQTTADTIRPACWMEENMANILVSGLINTETTVRVRQFPVNYYPIDYPFFGVNTAVSGVAYNISKALKTLGDDVTLLTMTGRDFPAEYIQSQLCTAGIGTDWVKPRLKETPNSVVLYDGEGKRQIYCDLKDIQETPYDFPEDICRDADVVAACNINFNRPLLHQAKTLGKTVATDVHVLSDIHDEFNREFMSCADILFLSDEGIRGDYRDFLRALGDTYGNRIIVLGRGAEGAAMYLREENRIFALPAVQVGEIVNTVGAGDALFSGFLHHFARGYHPLDALARAQVFASAKIRVSGAANGFPAEKEMESLCREYAGRMEYYEV